MALWFMIFLLSLNIIAIASLFSLLLHNKRGIVFLLNTQKTIEENEDPEQLAKISNKDIPAFIKCFSIVKSTFYFSLFTLNINIIMFIFVLYPALMITDAWGTMIWVAAAMNAFVVITFRGFARTKDSINAICTGYNALLDAYSFMKEQNHDSSG